MKPFALAATVLLLLTACTPKYTDPHTARATKGSANAQVVIEEFGDFQCPACGAAYQMLKPIRDTYGDRVLWKFYNYPLYQIHPYAFDAALAAECANDQGKYWEYHDTLYENQQNLKSSDLSSYAQGLGLNMDSFTACVKSRAKSSLVHDDIKLGDSRGVNSTPTFFLNGDKLIDWSTLGSRLDAIFAPLNSSANKTTN